MKKPIAYVIYGIGFTGHYVRAVKPIKNDDWKIDDDGLGDHWGGNAALVVEDELVPVGKADPLPGSGGGFTMGVFHGDLVPVGTELFMKKG
jgi:hypothetical protein